MNIHGFKLKIKEVKDKIKTINNILSGGNLEKEEKKNLINQKYRLIRKENSYKNSIKSIEKQRKLRR